MRMLLLSVMILCSLFTAINSSSAQTWTQTGAPSQNWTAIASSADGNKLFAIVGGSYVFYASTNSGATWTANNEPQAGSTYGSWSSIVSSADGSKLVAATANLLYISTNSGITWLSNNVSGPYRWQSMAMSADGSKLVGVDGLNSPSPGLIYTSTNSGITWIQTSAPSNYWSSVASSADGTKLVAVAWPSPHTSPGSIYTSSDSGSSWNRVDAPVSNWVAVASSADGTKLAAASDIVIVSYDPVIVIPGLIYTSTNSGTTWTACGGLPTIILWQGVAISADGSRLVAVSQGNNAGIYTSTNSGVAWVSNNVPVGQTWYGVTSSADGGKQAAVISGGGIYTASTVLSPQLNLAEAGSTIVFSWLLPSTNFVLQQNLDLTTTNWVTLSNAPALNLTNLNNELSLTPSNGSGYFRLMAQ
jgi:hypothetical protein